MKWFELIRSPVMLWLLPSPWLCVIGAIMDPFLRRTSCLLLHVQSACLALIFSLISQSVFLSVMPTLVGVLILDNALPPFKVKALVVMLCCYCSWFLLLYPRDGSWFALYQHKILVILPCSQLEHTGSMFFDFVPARLCPLPKALGWSWGPPPARTF